MGFLLGTKAKSIFSSPHRYEIASEYKRLVETLSELRNLVTQSTPHWYTEEHHPSAQAQADLMMIRARTGLVRARKIEGVKVRSGGGWAFSDRRPRESYHFLTTLIPGESYLERHISVCGVSCP